MHSIEPFYNWRAYYIASEDKRSPFYGRNYSEFEFTNSIYNYCIHPQWDSIGSETLFLKILYCDYDLGFVILEMMGEWNDAIENEVQSFYGDPTWSIEQVVNDPYYFESSRRVNGKYIINFNTGVAELYRDGESAPEEFLVQILTQDGVSIVKILDQKFDIGMIIDLRFESESVTFYQYGSSDIEYMKFTNFQIIKAS